ncbi:MAG: hypothetical protein Q9227_005932, partial [Pyrenula ochraceoflavens]
LVIPVCLIWRVQVPWTQKLALCLTLCLSIFLIAITLIRASGFKHHGVLDNTWEVYWNFVSTEVGLILTSLAAFRVLFVTQAGRHSGWNSASSLRSWLSDRIRRVSRSFRPWSWRNSGSTDSNATSQRSLFRDEKGDDFAGLGGNIPRAQMTGIRTFIDGSGRTKNMSRIMHSRVREEDPWDLTYSSPIREPGRIKVQHSISIV